MSNPKSRGQQRDKPFRAALMLEIAAAGENHKALRAVARALVEKASTGDVQAIKEIGDRLDGKVAQVIEATHYTGDPSELSDQELAAIASGRGDRTATSQDDPPVTH